MTQDRIGLCGPIPDKGGVAGYTASIVGRVVEKLAGLVIVVACRERRAQPGRGQLADLGCAAGGVPGFLCRQEGPRCAPDGGARVAHGHRGSLRRGSRARHGDLPGLSAPAGRTRHPDAVAQTGGRGSGGSDGSGRRAYRRKPRLALA